MLYHLVEALADTAVIYVVPLVGSFGQIQLYICSTFSGKLWADTAVIYVVPFSGKLWADTAVIYVVPFSGKLWQIQLLYMLYHLVGSFGRYSCYICCTI